MIAFDLRSGSRASLVACALLVGACRTATEVTVELTTDVRCTDDPQTSAQVGGPIDELDARPPFLSTTACSKGRIGSFVVTPSGDKDAEFSLKIMLAHGGRSLAECRRAELDGADFANCIVARRVYRFLPHTGIVLPVALRQDCDGVSCPPSKTCVHGSCINARTTDPPGPSIDGGYDAALEAEGAFDTGLAALDASTNGDSSTSVEGDARSIVDASSEADVVPIVDASVVTVRGKVIDYWRHPVPDAVVYIAGSSVTTDARGSFSFDNVAKPYDVGIAARAGFTGYSSTDAWLYVGLTRSDPTLQVMAGPHHTGTSSHYYLDNLAPGPSNDAGQPVTREIGFGFGSPDTVFTFTDYQPTGAYQDYFPEWWSVPTTAGRAHALLFERLDDDKIPTRFVSFDDQPMTLDEVTSSSVHFDLSPKNIPTSKVTGSVSVATAADIEVDAYLRFDDGAIIQVESVSAAPRTFEVTVPVIAGSTVTLSAMAGSNGEPFGIAHVDGVMPGEPTVPLVVPSPLLLVAPEAGATDVTASTTFQWNASPSVARLVVYCKGPTPDDPVTYFYVVTEDRKAVLPSLGGTSGIPLPKNAQCIWSVETHGAYSTVDALAGSPTGWLDPFSYYRTQYWGPIGKSGSYSASGGYYLTTAP